VDLYVESNMAEVDAALRRVKAPLRQVRERFNMRDDITYGLHYDAAGTIYNVTIELAPPELPVGFYAAVRETIQNTIRFPSTGQPGSMNFLDLGPDTTANAQTINAASDQARFAEEQARRVPKWVTILLVTCAIITYILIQALPYL
jgi:hypothetical protein